MDELLRSAVPLVSTTQEWGAEREIPIRITGYIGSPTLVDELVSSIRCIVRAESKVVLCVNDNDTHPWPGGRREPGESWAETARREVREETGWIIDDDSLEQVGWLHFEYLTERPLDWPYPHPDFLQVVYVADAVRRLEHETEDEWTDIDSWERTSRLASIPDALELVDDDVPLAFLREVQANSSQR